MVRVQKQTRNCVKREDSLRFVLIAALMVLSCGQKSDLPPYPEPAEIPGDVYTPQGGWKNLSNVTDILLTRDWGSGIRLLVVRDSSQVLALYSGYSKADSTYKENPDVSFSASGLQKPVFITEGKNGDIFLYDAGAHAVKKFGMNGGPSLWSLTDTTWQAVTGIAVDDSSNVFVSDEGLKVIKKYSPTGKYLGIWAEQGTGYGYVGKPSQLFYDGEALVVADKGDGSSYPPRVERIRTDVPKTGVIEPVTMAQGIALSSPSDVFSDRFLNFYVADTGSNRVLKFSLDGTFQKFVNSYPPANAAPVTNVVSIAANEKKVYMVDRTLDRIVIYEYNP